MLQEQSWPADVRWMLTDFLMSDEGAQRGLWTPRFFVAQDQKILLTATGLDGWKSKIWPQILDVAGTPA